MSRYDRAFLDSLMERLGDYLEMTGRSTKKNFPCANPEHKDENPSMHFYGSSCFCFSCGARYDIFKLVGADYGIEDFVGQVEKTCELFHVSAKDAGTLTEDIRNREQARAKKQKDKPQTLRDYTKLFSYCQSRIHETDYPARRGLSNDIVEKAGLGFHPKFQVNKDGATWPVMIIPIDNHHFVARNTDPSADKNSRFHASSGGRVLYTRFSDIQNSKNPVWIVEGEIDALSIADAGGEVIALGSTQNVSKLLRYLNDHLPQSVLILALDSDDSGLKAQQDLKDGLRDMGVHFITARKSGYKDANAFLKEDRESFCQYVRREGLSASLSLGASR